MEKEKDKAKTTSPASDREKDDKKKGSGISEKTKDEKNSNGQYATYGPNSVMKKLTSFIGKDKSKTIHVVGGHTGENESLLVRKQIELKKLWDSYPPKMANKNKLFVFQNIKSHTTVPNASLTFSRWTPISDNKLYFPTDFQCQFIPQENAYNYERVSETGVEWHVNFADTNLFFAYAGSLFAQDEHQVAEHPLLACLREFIMKKGDDLMKPYTREAGGATPVLVKNVPRMCRIALDANAAEGRPKGLYGNNFAPASQDAIVGALHVFAEPPMSNIIAMAALTPGWGQYTFGQISETFRTAYTSFAAAVTESQLADGKDVDVVVHTGYWGTGAFGGDRVLMCLVQLIAAQFARVDAMVFHTFDAAGTKAYNQALALYETMKPKADEKMSVTTMVQKLVDEKFVWGMSNGT